MNANSPAVATSTPSPERSHPGENSPNDQLALGESEAMRRVQDLLAAGKLSVSDIVVFEYYRHSFTARVMADGSLRYNTESKAARIHTENSPSKLYSSPSEFASAMAASLALLDDKVAKTKGRVSINGWNSCTVNGRSLATIRNEMLHERKNELASLSTERVRESAPAVATGKQSQRRPEESSTLGECFVADRTVALTDSSQGFNVPSRNGRRSLLGQSPAGKKKPDLLTHRDDKISGESKEAIAMDKHDAAIGFEGTLGAKSPPRAHPSNKSAVHRTSPSPEVPINPTSERAFTELRNSPGTPAENASLHDKMRQDGSVSLVCDQRGAARTSKNVAKLSKQKSTRYKVTDSPQLQGDLDVLAKDDSGAKKEAITIGDEEKVVNVEKISKLTVEHLHQAKTKEQQQKNYRHSVCEDIRSQGLATDFKMTSSSRAAIDLSSESKGSSRGSKDNNGKKDDRLASVELYDGACTVRGENVISQARSSKEVADLQQEILGDSDSDEESVLERQKGNMRVPKKRSRSPSSDENRKKKRTGDYPHAEMDGAGTRPEDVQGRAFGDKTLPNDKTELEAVHLDPDTVEAAAIAAQIEKEEASTRARRTTRLAAGKIKQVDYKASTGVQVPRSVSPEFGWEDNNKRSIEIEPSIEIARTTRRRSAPNQLQPPQRSSRRVARLRNSYEREMSSTEETGYHGARSLGGGHGCDVRSDRGSIHNEDIDGKGSQGFRPTGLRSDASERRRGRPESSSKRTRHHFHEDGDPDSHGRAYSTRASTRENSVVDGSEIADLRDSDDFLSDAEDLQDMSDAGDGSDLLGLKISDIKCLAEAIRLCESADPKLILRFLSERDQWKNDDFKIHRTRDFLQEIIEGMQNLPAPMAGQKDSTSPAQALSFLSAEFWRLSSGGNLNGSSRKPTNLVRRAGKEDQIRVSSERSRKKEHRDVEELRASLEKEMESRRRAELDALFTEIHLCEVNRGVAREKTKCCHLEQETKKYRDMESIIRGRLEGAKMLVGQLRGGTEESDAVGVGAIKASLQDGTRKAESLTNGPFVLPSLRTERNERIAEDDAAQTNKNITTTSRRLMEMDRLRTLIAAREVEAEEFQRICEKERMHFVSTLELKTRFETEIYMYKSQGSVTHGFGNSSALPLVNSTAKDSLKKGDTRGGSTHTTRGPGYTKQKAGFFGKNATAAQFTNNQKLALPGSRPKPGRAIEVPKQVKRKPFGRNGGNGNDK